MKRQYVEVVKEHDKDKYKTAEMIINEIYDECHDILDR